MEFDSAALLTLFMLPDLNIGEFLLFEIIKY